jgi:hypothetical protein
VFIVFDNGIINRVISNRQQKQIGSTSTGQRPAKQIKKTYKRLSEIRQLVPQWQLVSKIRREHGDTSSR